MQDIIVKNANLIYQGSCLFNQLNFCIQAKQTTCILGPSGVGKTTLMKMIAGIEKSDAQISLANQQPLDGLIAYMSQQDSLLPWMTVLENVLLGHYLRGDSITSARKRAIALLKQVGLETSAAAKPVALSGGMRQRAALVRTVIEDRDYILLDEPFAALDAVTRYQLQNLTAQLLQDKTVCLITHDPKEALRLGHHIYVMRGRPAVFDQVIQPSGKPPRDIESQQAYHLETRLMQQLIQAQETIF